jgi:hypothetical protein
LPTHFLKTYHHGLFLLVENEILIIKKFNINPLLPLDTAVDLDNPYILGQNYYIDVLGEKSSFQPSIWGMDAETKALEKIIYFNQVLLHGLMEKLSSRQKSFCVMF